MAHPESRLDLLVDVGEVAEIAARRALAIGETIVGNVERFGAEARSRGITLSQLTLAAMIEAIREALLERVGMKGGA